MGKVIAWLVLIFVVLFALRVIAAAQCPRPAQGEAHARRGQADGALRALRRVPAARPRRKRDRRRPTSAPTGGCVPPWLSRMQPRPAIPPFEPPPLPSLITESGAADPVDRRPVSRRLRRAAARHGAVLRPARDLRSPRPTPSSPRSGSISSSACSRSGGCSATRCCCRCPRCCSSLLVGDVFFLALLIYSGGAAGGPLPILLFPQLAASGWLMRTQVAFFHAALASSVLLGLDALAPVPGHHRRRAAVPDRAGRLRLFRDRRHRRSRSAATPRRARTSPPSAASTSPTSSRSTASSSRTCRTACWSST